MTLGELAAVAPDYAALEAVCGRIVDKTGDMVTVYVEPWMQSQCTFEPVRIDGEYLWFGVNSQPIRLSDMAEPSIYEVTWTSSCERSRFRCFVRVDNMAKAICKPTRKGGKGK